MNDRQSFDKHVAQTTPYPIGLEIERAEGCVVYTTDGKEYLDLIAGVAVNNIGHSHPKITEAISRQASDYMHVMVYGEYIQSPQSKFAESLLDLLPPTLDNVYFVNSGTEANEAALKLAKRATGRSELISFRGSYHGSTHGSLSVSGNETKKLPFRPLLPDVRFLRHNAISDLTEITEKTAGVIIEVIQGDAGVRIPDVDFLVKLRNRCSEVGALLIFDEIQTGFGRTGKMFGFEHFGVVPDVLTIGKAMAGGMPMGGMIANRELMKELSDNPILGHITTFGGHPVCCAAGLANLEVFRDEIDLEEVEKKGAYLENKLKNDKVKEIRRKGLMFAVDLADFDEVKSVFDHCLENGLLTFWFLSTSYAFRLSPPLTISYKQLDRAASVIQEALDRI
ncbi:aspartate aminotransferase family protein [Salibacter halophilus]|uniref:Aspartate aminotransferase family protein n=1 Tax=Salibacter halophilus TaxID=1803916 RepID=A0A6N6M6F3_9FLAO|nr:aspartate aminotransferase family protein [Salibacter halophilus]KAB1065187.1 aspartate aminotransferase family protein [Salibacter halophilus]